MRDTAAIQLDKAAEHMADEIHDILSSHRNAEIADPHLWQIGPKAPAAIVSVRIRGDVSVQTIRERLRPVHEVMHLSVAAARRK